MSYGGRNLITGAGTTTPQQRSSGRACALLSCVPAAPETLAAAPRGRGKGIDEGADYLAALGFDEHPGAGARRPVITTALKKHAVFG